MKIEIDAEQFAKDGALGSLIKQLTEAAFVAKIDSHLTQNLNKNRKNGYATQKLFIQCLG